MLIGFPSTRVGLDAGTANTLLHVKGRGVALNEPSLVTIRVSTGAIESVGGEAEAGRGRTPRKFQTARPIRAGMIADARLLGEMLVRFLRKADVTGPFHRLKVTAAIPGGMIEVDRLALIESLRAAGAAGVLLVDQTLAAATGAGLAFEECRGRVVVDIGAGLTEVATISSGGGIQSRATRVAGDELDAAIAAQVRSAHDLLIGELTAERLKIRIGSAVPNIDAPSLAVKGRCATAGVPREATIRACEVREAISAPLERIADAIREALEEAPPDLTADLIETGIVLTGGSALLRGLDQFISFRCGLPVIVAHDPRACVIRGLAYQLNHLTASDWRRFGNTPYAAAASMRRRNPIARLTRSTVTNVRKSAR